MPAKVLKTPLALGSNRMITFVKKIHLTHKISIFASGSGSNADVLIHHFKKHPSILVHAIFTNKENAGVVEIAIKHGVRCYYFSNESFASGHEILKTLQDIETDYIVLAGFLRKIPMNIIQAYSDKIINIHPSLLPKHGGKDMYGKRVHEAVLAQGDSESGITVHLVNEEYDKGEILAQFSCAVDSTMLVDDLAKKIQDLEHAYYKTTIEKFILHV